MLKFGILDNGKSCVYNVKVVERFLQIILIYFEFQHCVVAYDINTILIKFLQTPDRITNQSTWLTNEKNVSHFMFC